MKQLFIGLLIIAAGAGTFFLLQKKKAGDHPTVDKELLLGTWKIDSMQPASKDTGNFIASLIAKDSSLYKYRFDFQKNGSLVQSMNDSLKVDSSSYGWTNYNELVIKESPEDSTGEIFLVNKLRLDSLILQPKDSTVFVLTKMK